SIQITLNSPAMRIRGHRVVAVFPCSEVVIRVNRDERRPGAPACSPAQAQKIARRSEVAEMPGVYEPAAIFGRENLKRQKKQIAVRRQEKPAAIADRITNAIEHRL